MRQKSFNNFRGFQDFKSRREHGGDIRKGKRKLIRPFDTKLAVHLVLRSSRARGVWSLLKAKHEKLIYQLVLKYANRFGIKIYQYANGGNHLHILLKASSKKAFQNFLRSLAGVVPRVVMKAEKGSSKGKFWDELAYSKVVGWGRQFKQTTNYIIKNAMEAFGILPPRETARGHIKIDYRDLMEEKLSNMLGRSNRLFDG